MGLSAGIDFGTTNSTIGYSNGDSRVNMVPLANNGEITDRTAVFYSYNEKGKPFIGEEGKQRFIDGEEGRLITSPKSFLSSREFVDVGILKKRFSIVEIISDIVQDFKEKMENDAGESIDSILVGRPVNFHDTKSELNILAQERLEQALKLAGFKYVEFQYEPIAAYNAFQNKNPHLIQKGEKTLVIDIGGGTTDFSMIIDEGGLFNSRVISNGGIYIGGDTLDKKLLYSHYAESFGKGNQYRKMGGGKLDVPVGIYGGLADKTKLLFLEKDFGKIIQDIYPLLVTEDEKAGFGRLREIIEDLGMGYYAHQIIEQAKIGLTETDSVTSEFSEFNDSFESKLHRKQFEEYIAEEVSKIQNGIIDIMKTSGVDERGIQNVVLNGGTSLIPIIQRTIEDIVGKGKILHGNDLSSVGYGLTLESPNIFK